VLACSLTVFAVAGIALWSQLTIGWQWSAPSSGATRTGMLLMSGSVLALVVLALLAIAPVTSRTHSRVPSTAPSSRRWPWSPLMAAACTGIRTRGMTRWR
jgi:hypothetical protein